MQVPDVLFRIFPVTAVSNPCQASMESIRDSLAEELVKMTAEVRFYCCSSFSSSSLCVRLFSEHMSFFLSLKLVRLPLL